MILLVHEDSVVIEIVDLETNTLISISMSSPMKSLFYLANNYKERIIIWCHKSLKSYLNKEKVKESFQLKNMMFSYSEGQYLSNQIGYIEDSPFLKVNKKVTYPTWLMSSKVGAIYGSQLLKFESNIKLDNSFDFSLNSIAKLGMANGLFCYSEPKLLNNSNIPEQECSSMFELFKFAKLHYKWVWSFLLFTNFIIYDSKLPLISFFRAFFIKQKKFQLDFDLEPINHLRGNVNNTLDVIIPTLGRKKHLYNFLIDLSNQSILPKVVIVIEQNQDEESVTDLDFISNRDWPFKIIHKFIHQLGACNSRNIGLNYVESDYVFFADDDIRITSDFIESSFKSVNRLHLSAITLSCLRKKDVKELNKVIQWTAFGSGCSFVKTSSIKGKLFDMKYEFGYGEDIDFGMQLRNSGADIVYLPYPEINHIKAPIGGFRTKFVHPWESQDILPKPSPTVMLNRSKNTTRHQLLGYKTKLFIQFYKNQKIKNPIAYFKSFKKQWQLSEDWAINLNKQS